MVMLNAAFVLANPIAPSFWACDSDGRLFEVYVVMDYGSGNVSWFSNHVCDLPTHGSAGAGEIAHILPGDIGVVQGRAGFAVVQRVMLDYSCTAVGGPIVDAHTYTGLQTIDGTLYAVDSPAGCGTSAVWQLDPATGAALIVGPTGVGAIEGLAWDPAAHALYGVTSCPPEACTLVRIDRATGHATPIGNTGIVGLASLDFTSGELVGGTDGAHGGQLYRIDPVTAHATLVAPAPNQEITDFAGLDATGYGFVVPARRPTWGHVKAQYR
jgi:hypothetical protein